MDCGNESLDLLFKLSNSVLTNDDGTALTMILHLHRQDSRILDRMWNTAQTDLFLVQEEMHACFGALPLSRGLTDRS